MTWKKIFQALQKKTDDLVLLVTFVISEGVRDLLASQRNAHSICCNYLESLVSYYLSRSGGLPPSEI